MDNILNELAKCSIDFLVLLIKKHSTGVLDLRTFCLCAETKIKFLEDNINRIKARDLSLKAVNVINLYYKSIEASPYSLESNIC